MFETTNQLPAPGTRAAAGCVRAWISTGTIHSSALLTEISPEDHGIIVITNEQWISYGLIIDYKTGI
jgi:hypothetical protein